MMRRRLCSIGGMEIWLHPALLLFFAYMALSGYGQLCVVGMLSILAHEMSHGFAALLCRAVPQAIELTPLGCVLRMEDESRLPPLRRLIIILAGPCCTALLCILSLALTERGALAADMGRMCFACNAAILLVNLLPALPLDGGRLLSLLLGQFLTPERVRQTMRMLGVGLGVMMIAGNVALCLWGGGVNLSLGLAGCFLIYAASVAVTSAAMQELQQLMARKTRLETRGSLRGALVAVMGTSTLRQAVRELHPARYTQLMIVERGTMRVLGTVGEDALIAAYLEAPHAPCSTLI